LEQNPTPKATDAPPTPTIDYAKKNFDIVDRADVGEKIILRNVDIFELDRIHGSLPLIGGVTDHYAIAASSNPDGSPKTTYAVITGATCLWEHAEANGNLDESTRIGNPNSDAAVIRYVLKSPIKVEILRAEAGKDLPRQTGGKILHITSYSLADGGDEVACQTDSGWLSEKAKDAIEEIYLKSEDIKEK
jgi:hypothetical protein